MTAPACGCSAPSPAGFGGVSLFAFGYEDEATWNAINAISRQLAADHDAAPSAPTARTADRPG